MSEYVHCEFLFHLTDDPILDASEKMAEGPVSWVADWNPF
jgi:hypothetical protein